jgi:hypothetical protein
MESILISACMQEKDGISMFCVTAVSQAAFIMRRAWTKWPFRCIMPEPSSRRDGKSHHTGIVFNAGIVVCKDALSLIPPHETAARCYGRQADR